jgi:hypothetical protein
MQLLVLAARRNQRFLLSVAGAGSVVSTAAAVDGRWIYMYAYTYSKLLF